MSSKERRRQERQRARDLEQQAYKQRIADRERQQRTEKEEGHPSTELFSKSTHPFLRKLFPKGYAYNPANDKAGKGWYGDDAKFAFITGEEAWALVHQHMYPFQRPASDDHILDLSNNIEEGIDIGFGIGPDMHPVLVNGQHTLNAIYYKSGSPMRCRFTLYQCRDNDAAVASLYSVFDSNRRRSATQIVSAHVSSGMINCDVAANRLNRWGACAIIAKGGFRRGKPDRTNTARLKAVSSPEVIKFAEWMQRMCEGVSAKIIARLVPQGVGSAFFAMFVSDEPKASQFVRNFLVGANLPDGHPCLVLRDKMMEREYRHADVYMPILAGNVWHCWQKFCRGELVRRMGSSKELKEYNHWKVVATDTPVTEEVENDNIHDTFLGAQVSQVRA